MHLLQRLLILPSLLLLSLCQAVSAADRQLVILNWSEYMSPELISKFEKEFKAEVREVFFGSVEQATQLLLESKGQGYDLILTSSISLPISVKRGWISALNQDWIPNLKHIDPHWQAEFQGARRYGVPYFWGTTGIAYRSDLLSEDISSWMQLYRPSGELQGKIAMIDDPQELLGMGLKALGYSANSRKPEELKAVGRLLLNQKPHVKTYSYTTLDQHAPILKGEVLAAFMFSGDALMLQQHNPELKYVVPKEGGNIWIDYLAVGAKSKQKKLAHQFLNFINEPEHAAMQAQYVHYATPNMAAEKLLPTEFLNDPVIYPPPEVMDISEFYTRQPARSQRLRNQVISKVLSLN